MAIRLQKCKSCNHRMRLGMTRCGKCFHPLSDGQLIISQLPFIAAIGVLLLVAFLLIV